MSSGSHASKNYPPLLYAKGKAPSQQKSMSYYSYMSNFQMVKQGVGDDAWDEMKASPIGVLIRFYELDFTWSAKLVHHLLTHQLLVMNNYELWSLIWRQPVRFSLIEFGHITGLNCNQFDDGDTWDADHTEFWRDLGVHTSVGPTFNQLRLVLDKCSGWSPPKRKMVGLLCILHLGIYGIAPSSRIPLDCAKRVLNDEAFARYPWGRVGCRSLINSIKYADYKAKKSYTMEGFVQFLKIWAYESFTGLGELYGGRIEGGEVPLLSWAGSRKRINFGDFITQEKKAHNDKVRVRHFLPLKYGQIMPLWDDEVHDEDLADMVRDIQNNRLNETAWEVTEEPVIKRRKRKETTSGDDWERSKKQKTDSAKPRTVDNIDDEPPNVDGNAFGGEPNTNQVETRELLSVLKNLTTNIANMDSNIEQKLKVCLDTAFSSQLAPLKDKIAILEEELNFMKKQKVEAETTEAAHSNANVHEEVSKPL